MKSICKLVIPKVSHCWEAIADSSEYPTARKKDIKERQCDNSSSKCCIRLMEDLLSYCTSDQGATNIKILAQTSVSTKRN